MSIYKLAVGHNNAAGLVTVTPQPMSPGILYPRQVNAASGDVYDDGRAYTVWLYDGVLTPAQYAALLTAFGLASARTALVTVATVTDEARTTWASYNARIVRPFNGSDARFKRGFWRDVTFVLRNLEAL